MAEFETFNLTEAARTIPVAELTRSFSAVMKYLADTGHRDLAERFAVSSGATFHVQPIVPEVLEAACAFCERQGETGLAEALHTRFAPDLAR